MKTLTPEFRDGEKYLCAIGTALDDEKILSYDVGTFNKNRNAFSFHGCYSTQWLNFREKIGSCITTVLKAKLIDDIELEYDESKLPRRNTTGDTGRG